MKVISTYASTFFLKAVVLIIGVAVFVICAYLFPNMWRVVIRELPEFINLVYPALIGFFLTVIPFFFALYQVLKLLHYIDKNNAFSEASVKALKNIKYSAIATSMLYATVMPLVFAYAEYDDAPGLVLMGMAITCAPLIIATFAAVLQKLVQSALDMKLENDLTV